MSYEFNDLENRIFLKASFWMKFVGFVLGLLGGLGLVVAIMQENTGQIASNVVSLVTSGFLIMAGMAFKKIVVSEGDDMAHTMDALRSLRGYFFIQAVMVLIMVGNIIHGILVGMG